MEVTIFTTFFDQFECETDEKKTVRVFAGEVAELKRQSWAKVFFLDKIRFVTLALNSHLIHLRHVRHYESGCFKRHFETNQSFITV